ncbi:MAG: AzlD domain-containing protein [Pseudomonadota bacterium]
MMDTATVWFVILLLGLGSYLLRFVFIGIVGDRPLPPWLLRHLRYTAVAILPGLVTPLVVWPQATGGVPDPARLIATVVTILVGWRTKSVISAILSGAAALYLVLYLTG